MVLKAAVQETQVAGTSRTPEGKEISLSTGKHLALPSYMIEFHLCMQSINDFQGRRFIIRAYNQI